MKGNQLLSIDWVYQDGLGLVDKLRTGSVRWVLGKVFMEMFETWDYGNKTINLWGFEDICLQFLKFRGVFFVWFFWNGQVSTYIIYKNNSIQNVGILNRLSNPFRLINNQDKSSFLLFFQPLNYFVILEIAQEDNHTYKVSKDYIVIQFLYSESYNNIVTIY